MLLLRIILYHSVKGRQLENISYGISAESANVVVAYEYNKENFFPWLSYERYEGYHKNLWGLMDILESLGKIAIVPVGKKN